MNHLSKSRPAVAGVSFALSLCMALASTSTSAAIAQTPLLLGGGAVPGNLILTPSVEFPTVISVANTDNTYVHSTKYVGYFDSAKCYTYQSEQIDVAVFGTITANDGGGYFRPSKFATDCTGEWSGNYLNWATTQTIDPFRKALTGGYRVVDTASQTILEKATRATRSSYFPNRSVGTTLSGVVSPYSNATLASSVTEGTTFQKNKAVHITRTVVTQKPKPCSKNCTTTTVDDAYYTVRVEVCVPGLLESNCVKYGSNYKPEGLIQQYAKNIRYSVFGYVAEDGNSRNGGVLRSQQKYVGDTLRTPGVSGEQNNTQKEWDPTTGILKTNPDGATVESNSGVINYINKFGELTNYHKSNDPVSELYYAALRYLKNQGNIAAWSNTTNDAQRDKFPIITNWADPIQYACQKNVILGIGDVNTHEDHQVPAGGDTLNVDDYTQKLFTLEGITKGPTADFSGRNNSAYIAGLAYYANTTDIRSAMAGTQTASTHWVDVREGGSLLTKNSNQYWLAAKYGGFKVPNNYQSGTALADNTWWTSNEYLENGNKRPDNFYVASDANNMIASLTKAFAQIANEVESTTASLASNSTRLDTDTAVFQSRLNSTHWSGDLLAKLISNAGVVATTATWSAAAKLDAQTPSARNILTIAPADTTDSAGPWISTTGSSFTWSGLSTTQQAALQVTGETDSTVAQQRLNYLRGDRSNEKSISNQTLPFRMRGSVLGDIVNSDPQYAFTEDFGYGSLSWNNGSVGSAYTTFRTGKSTRTPLIVVGANDGMLHGFNASVTGTDGGSELFAVVPNAAFTNLASLTDPAYSHRYFVDGTPRIADAYINSGWKTLVAATTGAGGKSIFVVDVSNPSSVTSSSVLWEFSHPAMGNTMGQPSIVALPNGKFGVVVSSGYHETAPTEGHVWVLDAADGSIIKDFTIPSTGNLGQPLATDITFDRVADRIYVADTLGNVWRLDLGTSAASGWGIPSSLGSDPLFIAKDGNDSRQAITAPLNSAFNDKSQHMVFFGTGSFYQTGDNEIPAPANRKVDTVYGIIDQETAIDGRSTLLEQTVIKEDTVNGNQVRAISKNLLTTEAGWFLDLAWLEGTGATGAKGERVIAKANVRSGLVTFTSMTPSADPCKSGGTSMIMTMDLSSGSRLNYVYYDTSGDGALDEVDTSEIDGEDVPWSGIGDPDDGVIKGVTNVNDGQGGGWLCYAGSSGANPVCIKVAGALKQGRQSWREIRTTN